jgi:sirohydrochlorin ferrochelatase
MTEGEMLEDGPKAERAWEAVILLGHGSRVPEAGKDMEKVASRLKEKYGYRLVEVCFMSRLGPHFPEVFEKCVRLGAGKVLVIPYFLHSGLHLVLDLPEMLQEQAKRFPDVSLQMGRGFGFDEALVDLVQARIEETRSFEDVRQTVLPPKEKYPVPEGQCEFVPVPPDETGERCSACRGTGRRLSDSDVSGDHHA